MNIKTFSAALLVAAAALPAYAASNKLDLGTYSVKYAKSLVPPSGAVFSEASGMAYNWDRNSLFIVGDEGSGHEFNLDGDNYTGVYRYLGLSTFQDPEGVTYIGNGQYVLAEERNMRMWLTTPSIASVKPAGEQWDFGGKQSGKFYNVSPFNVGNIGLEGIAYDVKTGGFFGVKQQGPQAVYFINVDMNNPAGGSHMELFDPALLGLSSLSDIAVLSTVNAFAGEGFADNLLILSAASEKLLEVSRSGEVLSSFDLSSIFSETGARIQTIEGVVVDKDGNIYLAAELGGVQGSSLIALRRAAVAAVPEPATWAMMIGGFALAGSAMRRRKIAVRFAA